MIQQIILGDCLEILPKMRNSTINMVLVDLPFQMTSNSWDCEIDLEKLWKQYLRIGVQNAVFAFCSAQPFTSKLILSQPNLWRHEWIWIKNRGSNFANTVREPFKEHESIQIFSRGKWTYNKQTQERTGTGKDRVKYELNQRSKSENYKEFEGREGTKQGELRVPSSHQKFNTETGLHPTQKPVALMEYLIKTYTNENDIILDNSAGSGAMGMAAKNLNRQFVLIEKEEKYYNICLERLGKLNGQ